MRRVGAVAVLVLVSAALLVTCRGDEGAVPQLEVLGGDDAAVDHDYLIPAGTQERIRAGEQIEIMPERLEVTVGESIRIRNEDSAGAFVGIFYVGAGETVRMRFTTPGELTGKCEVSSSGEFTIDVKEA